MALRVGFVGLGTMGVGMARNLGKAGIRAESLLAHGVEGADAGAGARRPSVREPAGGRRGFGRRRLVPARRARGRRSPPRAQRHDPRRVQGRDPHRLLDDRSGGGALDRGARGRIRVRLPRRTGLGRTEGRARGHAHLLRRRRRRGPREGAARLRGDGQADHAPRTVRLGAARQRRPTRSSSPAR